MRNRRYVFVRVHLFNIFFLMLSHSCLFSIKCCCFYVIQHEISIHMNVWFHMKYLKMLSFISHRTTHILHDQWVIWCHARQSETLNLTGYCKFVCNALHTLRATFYVPYHLEYYATTDVEYTRKKYKYYVCYGIWI